MLQGTSEKLPSITLVWAIAKQNFTINNAYPVDLSKDLSVADWLRWQGKKSLTMKKNSQQKFSDFILIVKNHNKQ